MSKLIQLCGIPASGKSTYTQKELKNYIVVSLDDIRRVFFGHQFHQNAEPFIIGIAKNVVRLLLEQRKNVVIDSTALRYSFRIEWKAIADEYGANYSIIWFDTPKSVCLKRNSKRPEGKRVPDEVIERMSSQFQSPEAYELSCVFEADKVKIKRIKWLASKKKT